MRAAPPRRAVRHVRGGGGGHSSRRLASPRPSLRLLGGPIASIGRPPALSRSSAAAAASGARRSRRAAGLVGRQTGKRRPQEEGAGEGKEPPPGAMSGRARQGSWAEQAPPLPRSNSPRSEHSECCKWPHPLSASILGHLQRRRRPQAWSRAGKHEILTACGPLRRWIKEPENGCLWGKVPAPERFTPDATSRLELADAREVKRAGWGMSSRPRRTTHTQRL